MERAKWVQLVSQYGRVIEGIDQNYGDIDDRSQPERGFPIVTKFYPVIQICDWCDQTVNDRVIEHYVNYKGEWITKCTICRAKKQGNEWKKMPNL
jgi:hypothetical protein